MAKKIISLFFLLLFMTQVLPLKQVGQLIAGASMTEELPDSGASKSIAKYPDAKWFATEDDANCKYGLNNNSQTIYIHFSETLPHRFASDVQTPPPDFFC